MPAFFFLRQKQMAEAKSIATSSSKCPAFLSRYFEHISLAASFSTLWTLEYELSFAVWISSAIISFCSKEGDALVNTKLTQTFISIWIGQNMSLALYLLLLLLNGWFIDLKALRISIHETDRNVCLQRREKAKGFLCMCRTSNSLQQTQLFKA